MKTENVSTLKIHKLTKEQYDRELAAGRIDETALYLTTGDDEGTVIGGGVGRAGTGLNAELFNTAKEASGESAHAEGYGTTASGNYAHAEGKNTTASGNNTHAEGAGTTASMSCAHAEGDGSRANAYASHAEGSYTAATANSSHAEGFKTKAYGNYSHAEGYYTIAEGDYIHSQGVYNINLHEPYLHIVGNGTSEDNRSNAHTLDSYGDAWYAGNVYVGSTSGKNRDEGSKKLATEEYVNSNAIVAPVTASIGQVLVVKAVDANGRPTEWEAIDLDVKIAEIV